MHRLLTRTNRHAGAATRGIALDGRQAAAANGLAALLAALLAAPLLALTGGSARGQDAPRTFALQEGVRLRAATVDEARAVLAADDRFTSELSRFDLESRMQKLDVTREDYDRFVSQSVRAWDDELLAKVFEAAATVRGWLRAQRLAPPFPKEILLISTTGEEEGNAAYCRGAAIVLPAPKIKQARPGRLASLMAHELFHILSANNEPLRRRLYATIGFRPCPRIALPDGLAPRKLTNPDGPGLNYFIELRHDGRPVRAVPLLLASVDRYDPKRGGTFFKYLQFRLLTVEPDSDGRWRPLQVDGGPLMLDPKKSNSFFQQIGRNTDYIVHPDEILADNFVFLLQDKQDLKSPEVVRRMREILRPE